MAAIGDLSSESREWLELCRRVATAQRDLLEAHPTQASRSVELGMGEGGDRSLEIDVWAEDVVFRELRSLDRTVIALSEERGSVTIGPDVESARARRVIIDPLDGSFNAKRRIPAFAVSIAVAFGDAIDDVFFGYVCNLATAEEFVAELGRGAWHDGAPIGSGDDEDVLEVIGLESVENDPTTMGQTAIELESRIGRPFRTRVVGSTALALCDLAAGRFDGVVSVGNCRTVDFAAAQLVARESGRHVAFEQGRIDSLTFDLERRHRFVGARSLPGLRLLEASLQAVPVPSS